MFVEYKSSESTAAAVCPPGPRLCLCVKFSPHSTNQGVESMRRSASLAALNLSAEREGEIGNGCVCLVPE